MTMISIRRALKCLFISTLIILFILITTLSTLTLTNVGRSIRSKAIEQVVSYKKNEMIKAPTAMPDSVNVFRRLRRINDHSKIYKGETKRGELMEILDFDRHGLRYIYPELTDFFYTRADKAALDWSRFSYTTTAADEAELCQALMLFRQIREFGSLSDLVLIIDADIVSSKKEMIEDLQGTLGFKILTINESDDSKLRPTQLKLLTFTLTQYDRIIHLSPDSILTESHLDSLFFLPPVHLAAPASYINLLSSFNSSSTPPSKQKLLKHNWEPQSIMQRMKKLKEYTNPTMLSFLGLYTGLLPREVNQPAKDMTEKERANVKSFYNFVYSMLPSFPFPDELSFDFSLIVIQPSRYISNKLEKTLQSNPVSSSDEILGLTFNQDIPHTLFLQGDSGEEKKPFDIRLEEIPDLLLLPHQDYSTFTSHLSADNQESFFADVIELPWVWNNGVGEEKIEPSDGGLPYYCDYKARDGGLEWWLKKRVQVLRVDKEDGYSGIWENLIKERIMGHCRVGSVVEV